MKLDGAGSTPGSPRGDVHVLATLDESTYSGGTNGYDHPIAWCHDFDGGRSWYTGGGHTNESYSEMDFRQHLLGGIQTAAGLVPSECGGTEWANFEKVTLDNNSNEPMELDVAPDGRVFYIERTTGNVKVINPETNQTGLAGQLDVFSGEEAGLLGLALDPDFATNNWLYLYFSPEGPSVARLSRFTVVGNTLDMDSEAVILEFEHDRSQCCHHAGSIEFGPDGDLFIATGDDTNPFASNGYAPIDERRPSWETGEERLCRA